MDDDSTILEVKNYLRENWEEGVECPCCTQWVHLTPTKIDPTMAYWLIKLTQEYLRTGDFVDMARMEELAPMRNGNYAKLRHWDLIVGLAYNDDETKRASGKWRPTGTGIAFAKNKMTVMRTAHLFNRKVRKFSGEQVYIKDSLRDKFDFRELMSNFPDDESENLTLL